MASLSYLLSTALMGLFVLGVAVAVIRSRDWHDYSPTHGDTDVLDALRTVKGSPVAWMATFIGLVVVFGGAAVLYVGGATVPDVGASVGLVLAGGFAALIAGYLFVGAYSSARSRGRPASQAVAEGTVLLGMLLVVAIAAKLVVGA